MAIKLKFVISVVAKEALGKLGRENGSMYAAAVAFFGLVSLFPLMLLAIGVLGYVTGSYEESLNRVVSIAQDMIPVGTDDIERNLRILINRPGLLSGLGLLGFLWTGMQLFIILQKVMNLALRAEQPTGFLRKRGIALAMVIVASVLFSIYLGMVSLISPLLPEMAALHGALKLAARLVLASLAFGLAYKYLPSRDVGRNGPVVGGVTAGALFVLATYIFRWYTTVIADYGEVYGTLASVVVILLWIYYASLIAVIGAELTSVYADRAED